MELSWYKEGLHFKCTGCGRCCTGAPGYVWVEEDEIIAMAGALQISPEDFTRKYVRLVGDRLSLRELDAGDGDFACVFLKGNQCSVYEQRPIQCRTFPWWQQNVESKAAWLSAARHCEGINHPDAPLTPCEEIEKHL